MDALSRVVGEKLSASMGQPVIVENKPGASGGIGASAVAQAKPDGYTLLFAIASTIQSISLQKAPPFKLSELEPITQLAELPTGFAVRRDLGANTLADFVALAKAKPKTLSFGSFGSGSTGHIVGEGLAAAAKVEMVHVPYKGEAPAITDLLGGHISSAFASVGSLGQQSGTVKLLAITGSHRLKQFPDVPTFQELGFPTLRTDRLGWRLCAGWNAEGHCGQAGNRNRAHRAVARSAGKNPGLGLRTDGRYGATLRDVCERSGREMGGGRESCGIGARVVATSNLELMRARRAVLRKRARSIRRGTPCARSKQGLLRPCAWHLPG